MKLYRYITLLLIVFVLGSLGTAIGQSTVKGVLVDEQTKVAVADVTVSAGGKTTKTDNNGHFTITAKVGASITFTHIGYKEQKWKVPEVLPEALEIALTPKDNAMDQVVVQGFKQVKKSTVTGASTVISGKDIQDRPTGNVMELIQGRVAGFNVQINTGSPGAAPTMNLRGVSTTNVTASGNLSPTSPLFIIDGVPVDVNTNYQYGFESGGAGISPLSLIPPEDVESIEVLKDAAMTSQYGSKATYGVVIITTKRGQSKVPIISYSGSFFYKTPPRLRSTIGGERERQIRLNTILNYDTASRQASLALISQYPGLSDSLNEYYNNSTDWQSYFYRSTSNQQHNVNITGGDRNFNYKANLNYYNEKGIVVNTGLQRYSLNLLGTYNPTEKFYLTMSLQQDVAYKQNASGVGALQMGIAKNANTSSLLPPPSLFSNVEAMEAANAKNDGKLNNTSGSLNVQYEPLRGLRFSNLLAYSYISNTNDYVRSAYLAQDSAGVFAYSDRSYSLDNRSQVSFTKVVNDKHTFQAYAFNQITKDGFRANMMYFNQPADQQITGPIGNNYGISAGGTLSNINEGRIHGYGGNVSYNYDEKYVLEMAYRLDNTATNGPSRGYTKSPTFSGRWNFFKEKFFKSATWLSSGAIRGSWGRNIKPNGTIYDVYGKYVYGPKYNDGSTVMIDFKTLPNVEFEPEVAATTNLGLDLAFLNNRITFTADAYYKAIDNQLVATDLSNTNGFSRVSLNAQSIVNRGLEVATNFNIIQKPDVRWSVNMNGAWNEATLAHLPNGLRSITTQVQDAYGSFVPVISQLGGLPLSNLLYVTRGVYANNSDIPVNPATGLPMQYGRGTGLYFRAGDPIWADINGDYIIDNSNTDNADLVAVGNPVPKLVGGFGTQVVYKAFTLNVNTSLTAYRDILNLVLADQFNNYTRPLEALALVPIDGYNYWKPTNADRSQGTVGAVYPNPYDFRRAGALNPFRVNQTLYLENGTYFKINSVTVSYNVDRNLLKKYGLTSMRFSLTGQNLYNFTKYSGTSPEQVSSLGRDISGGYPLAKTYSFSVNVQF
ncbi:SusC/RagA family TonB-linked outer membrane protein [Niabella sp.]|uniref:SusC/RagA family TonB-linked outer membrane protein n=1 Tax=Niabella sp. TaxID=1962976 RepID=UPI00260E69A0|nr:SusC/RagA family TonB-linked outer membrane protein [Niabella sp.]